MKTPMLSTSELGQWLLNQIKTEAVGDRFNYGACDAWYRCGLRFAAFTYEEDAQIKRALDQHRQSGEGGGATDHGFGFRS